MSEETDFSLDECPIPRPTGMRNQQRVLINIGETLDQDGHCNEDVDAAVALVQVDELNKRNAKKFLTLTMLEDSTIWGLTAHYDLILNPQHLGKGSFVLLTEYYNIIEIGKLEY